MVSAKCWQTAKSSILWKKTSFCIAVPFVPFETRLQWNKFRRHSSKHNEYNNGWQQIKVTHHPQKGNICIFLFYRKSLRCTYGHTVQQTLQAWMLRRPVSGHLAVVLLETSQGWRRRKLQGLIKMWCICYNEELLHTQTYTCVCIFQFIGCLK